MLSIYSKQEELLRGATCKEPDSVSASQNLEPLADSHVKSGLAGATSREPEGVGVPQIPEPLTESNTESASRLLGATYRDTNGVDGSQNPGLLANTDTQPAGRHRGTTLREPDGVPQDLELLDTPKGSLIEFKPVEEGGDIQQFLYDDEDRWRFQGLEGMSVFNL